MQETDNIDSTSRASSGVGPCAPEATPCSETPPPSPPPTPATSNCSGNSTSGSSEPGEAKRYLMRRSVLNFLEEIGDGIEDYSQIDVIEDEPRITPEQLLQHNYADATAMVWLDEDEDPSEDEEAPEAE